MNTAGKSTEFTFAEYMEQALYGPRGYYSSGVARSGRQGDYFTAPDVGPEFGRLLTAILVEWQKRMNVIPFHLVEVGAGEGALAESMAKALLNDWRDEARRLPYTAVERSPARRESLQALRKCFSEFRILPSLRPLAASPVSGCLFANELVDAFPVHRVRMNQGHLQEAYIEARNLSWHAPSTPRLQEYLDRLNLKLPDGYETEINLAMKGWISEVEHSLNQGLVIIIDYGRPAHLYYALERDRGTLRSFRKHRVGSNPIAILTGARPPSGAAAGSDASEPMDLTADVDFTSLALDAREAGLIPLAFMELGSFLMLGAQQLNGRWGPSPLSLQYLLHPEGMGSAFHVLILGKGISTKDWNFEHNRLARLGRGTSW